MQLIRITPLFQPVFQPHGDQPFRPVLPVDHHRYFSVSGIPYSLLHGIVYIQPFNPFAFDMYSRDSDHISVTVRAAVLLSASGCISVLLKDLCKLPFAFGSFLSAVHFPPFSGGQCRRNNRNCVNMSILAFCVIYYANQRNLIFYNDPVYLVHFLESLNTKLVLLCVMRSAKAHFPVF